MKETIKLLFTGVGIILFWRGIWMAADEYLLKQYPLISIMISICAGASIIVWMKHKNI